MVRARLGVTTGPCATGVCANAHAAPDVHSVQARARFMLVTLVGHGDGIKRAQRWRSIQRFSDIVFCRVVLNSASRQDLSGAAPGAVRRAVAHVMVPTGLPTRHSIGDEARELAWLQPWFQEFPSSPRLYIP